MFALAGFGRAADGGAAANYTGLVVDEQGRPVAGAAVDCWHDESAASYGGQGREAEFSQHTVTDLNGAFSVPFSQGKTLAVVKKAGLATGWKTWSSLLDDSSEPLVLTAPTVLAGVALDENNQPVAGAEVWVSEAVLGNEYSRGAQIDVLSGQPARESFSAKTAADGRFRIENFPADSRAGLAVRREGKAQRPIGNGYAGNLDCQSGQDDIELGVGPAGAVEGKVTVTETGQPLGDVRINLRSVSGALYGTESLAPIESGSNGAFRIPGVQPGEYYVTGAMPGRPVPDWVAAAEDGQVTVVAGQTAQAAAIPVSKGVLVEVKVVVTNERTPLGDVAVSATGSMAYTDTNGVALFRVLPGENWFSASKKNWSRQNCIAGVVAGQTNHVQLEMIPPPRIAGTVRDPSGAPVAGALVSFHPGQYPSAPEYVEATTDKDGRYEMTMKEDAGGLVGWEGPVSLTNSIMARSLERNLAAVREFDVIPTNLDLSLEPGITLSGSVKDTDGKPVTNATADLSMLSGNSIPKLFPKPTKVDAQGSFTFPALPQGREYYFLHAITAKGYGAASGQVAAGDTKTNHYEFPVFLLKRADRKLAGQVLDPDGKPLAGATVNFRGQGQPQMTSARSNRKGCFNFNAVCEGPVQLSASWFGPPENEGVPNVMLPANGAEIRAQAGDTNIVIQLRRPNAAPNGPVPPVRTTTTATVLDFILSSPGATLAPVKRTTAGTVLDPAGAPAAGVELRLVRTEWDAMAGAEAFSDANGKYSFQWQSPGLLESDAANGSRSRPPPILIVRDEPHNFAMARYLYTTNTNIDLRLSEGLSLSGRVQDTGGKPAGGFKVILTMLDGDYRFTLDHSVTDAEGRFDFKGLPQEKVYSVSVNQGGPAKGYGVATGALTAREAHTNHYTFPAFVLKKADLQLAGYVLDADHRLLPGAVVRLTGEGQPALPSAKSDQQGHFAFDGVCEGPVTIFARGPTPAGMATLNGDRGQVVRGGETNLVLTLGDRKPEADVR